MDNDSSPSVFDMQNISVTRDGFDILRNINWEVKRGEHWVVLGANGSGKTSLLKVLMGYLPPTTGRVQMEGRGNAALLSDSEWTDWRQTIGFVSSSISEMIDPQETGLHVVVSGLKNVVNHWNAGKLSAGEIAAAERTLAQVQCAHLRDRAWEKLSQGERQRVLIGRAMMVPKLDILVLDEPCAGLDPVARDHFLSFVESLTDMKTFGSLIMVTHHVEEIIPNISHALVLRDGGMISWGEKRRALNSRSVSLAFRKDLTLRSRLGRYRLYAPEESYMPPGQII